MKTIIYLNLIIALSLFGTSLASVEGTDEFSGEVYPSVKDAFGDIINTTINNFLKNISDPVVVNSLNISLPSGSPLSGSANISNLTIQGLKYLFAPSIALNILNLAANITIEIPEISASLNYTADATLAELLPLYGDGDIELHLNDIILNINGSANVTGGIQLKDFSFNLTMSNNASFGISGLLNSADMSNVVTELINDNLASLINNHEEFITSTFSPVIKVLINTILKGNSTTEELYSVIMEDTTLKNNLDFLNFLDIITKT